MLDRADRGWEVGYRELRMFTEETGQARVPANFTTASGFNLGKWVTHRRNEYRGAWLTAGRVADLEALPGWSWNVSDEKWNVGKSELDAFVAERGHARVPRGFVTSSGYRLGNWVSSRRKDFRAGRINANRATELAAIPGWTWNVSDEQWDVGIRELRTFVTEHGHTRVRAGLVTTGGYSLGKWVSHKRTAYRAGTLSTDRVAELEAMPGWTWSSPDQQWDAGITELRAYVAERGHARVPSSFATTTGYKLGAWASGQRRDYQEGRLSPGRASELSALPGWAWSLFDEPWETGLAALRAFVTEHGHARVPGRFTTASGFHLGRWVNSRRVDYRAGRLNTDRATELEALPGWIWNPFDRQWRAAMTELRAFVAEHGHARVPDRFTTASGYNLGGWVTDRRRAYRDGTLNAARITELETLPGWAWSALDQQWLVAMTELRAFAALHGHARVPQDFTTVTGHRLGTWVRNRRIDYRAGKLTAERAAELEAIAGWAWRA